MIYKYLFPSERLLLFPPRGKAEQTKLVQRLEDGYISRGYIEERAMNAILLQVCRQNRAEALQIFIRLKLSSFW